VIIPQAEINRINSRMRQRVLRLPVRRGKKWGELKRCPMREGGVYGLQARVPYDTYITEAQQKPSRAQAVLWLIDRCDTRRHKVMVTVTAVEKQGDVWIVRFEKGDWRSQSDRPVYLARNNDFTMIASQQTVAGDPELLTPFAEDLRRAREKAVERRTSPQIAETRKAIDHAGTLQQSMMSMKTRNLAKRAERTLRALEVALLSESVVDSETVAATDGSQREVDRPPSASTLATPEAA
jgi:hypothetical protein